MPRWSRNFCCLFICLACASGLWGQTRKGKRAKPAGPPVAAKKDPLGDGAGRVAEQIKTLTRFLYLFGGIAKDLAAADEAAQKGETSSSASQQMRQNKAALIGSLRNVRDGLDKLEADFRFTPQLQRYYPTLKGVADNASAAEDAAAAGQYTETGRALLETVNQLTEVLLAMR